MASITYSHLYVPASKIANACASLEWRVFPLKPDLKIPYIKEWPTAATCDQGQIETWWGVEFPDADVAIATGPESGIWVLDIDVKNGSGYRTMSNLCRTYRVPETCLDTFTVRTPSGGAHLYYQYPTGDNAPAIRNSTSHIGAGVDVRGKGGYVHAPHGGYQVATPVNAEVRAAPEWLVNLTRRTANANPLTWNRYDVEHMAKQRAGGGTIGRYYFTQAIDAIRHAGDGERNDTLNRCAFLLGQLGAAGTCTQQEAWTHVISALKMNGLWEDDGEDQCGRTFVSGWTAGHQTANSTNQVEKAGSEKAAQVKNGRTRTAI